MINLLPHYVPMGTLQKIIFKLTFIFSTLRIAIFNLNVDSLFISNLVTLKKKKLYVYNLLETRNLGVLKPLELNYHN